MDETSIFTQLSMEMCPEWYYPVPITEVFENGRKGYKLAGNLRYMLDMPTPPWLVKSQ